MNNKQARIIKEYENKRYVHPSYGEIARKVGVSKTYVYDTIREWKLQNKVFGLKK